MSRAFDMLIKNVKDPKVREEFVAHVQKSYENKPVSYVTKENAEQHAAVIAYMKKHPEYYN